MPRIKTRLVVRPELRVTPRLVLQSRVLELDAVDVWEFLREQAQRYPVLELDIQDPFEARRTRETIQRIYDVPDDPRVGYVDDEERGDPVESSWIAPQPGMWQRIEWQMSLHFPSHHPDRDVAQAILERLDATGFLREPPDAIAQEMGTDPERVERVRRYMVEHFDPPGVASRDLQEFWRVWLRHHGLESHPFYTLLCDTPPEVFQDPSRLAQHVAHLPEAMRRDIQTLAEHLPRDPASVYDSQQVAYVVPDVIYRVVEGELVVEVNEPWKGRFRLSPRYREMFEQKDLDTSTRQFLRKQFHEVEDLLNALAERRRRLWDLAHFIADHQEAFLRGKAPHPAPLSRQKAVDALGIPHSTLSRLLKQKYADTPVGIFPLRFFFPTPIALGVTTEEDLKALMQAIIAEEDPTRPLKDEEIAQRLAEHGIHLSRRTVAHYRKRFGIPPSTRRKKRPS